MAKATNTKNDKAASEDTAGQVENTDFSTQEQPAWLDEDGMKAGAGTPRTPVPAGLHVARCIAMIEIGHIMEKFAGQEPTKRRKVMLTWEFPELLIAKKAGEEEKPMVISKEYTFSMDTKANLRKDLSSWRGVPFDDREAAEFDISKLLGKCCQINISHKAGEGKHLGKVFEVIQAIVPAPKVKNAQGKMVPAPVQEQVNKSRMFNYSRKHFDYGFMMKLPDFIKNKMLSSDEFNYLKINNLLPKEQPKLSSEEISANAENAGSQVPVTGIDKEDLPF